MNIRHCYNIPYKRITCDSKEEKRGSGASWRLNSTTVLRAKLSNIFFFLSMRIKNSLWKPTVWEIFHLDFLENPANFTTAFLRYDTTGLAP